MKSKYSLPVVALALPVDRIPKTKLDPSTTDRKFTTTGRSSIQSTLEPEELLVVYS